ncbi:sugar transferase (plasmid) [Skermanella sp. TT6]|uniref:Sugar transferase n=1 Tax=Skermanella cutis TaxID=2775420 RepID=A0ABX7BHH2_9PROT|nr:sugar transferase [Skermanella sp. TT6]QQP92748.1 sugar transferase [Skermanella sp. TT6]
MHDTIIEQSTIGTGTVPPLYESKPLYEQRVKRLFDIASALTLLIIFAPTCLIIYFLTRADGGPVLFRHKRIGAKGQSFDCLKFRTMTTNADDVLVNHLQANPDARLEWEATFKLRDDPRVTPIGRILRKTSLDELPQLINVLKGDMSMVGPRPIVEKEIAFYGNHFGAYIRCRPGITGAWQIQGRSDTTYVRRVNLDVAYVTDWSIAQDMLILIKTPLVVIRGSGAY